MAKEIIPPNPIPVGKDPVTNDNIFHCATMIDSGDQYDPNRGARSELIANLLEYLGSIGILWDTSDEFWKAYVIDESSAKAVMDHLCDHIDGLSRENLDEYIQIIETPDQKVTVVVFLV